MMTKHPYKLYSQAICYAGKKKKKIDVPSPSIGERLDDNNGSPIFMFE